MSREELIQKLKDLSEEEMKDFQNGSQSIEMPVSAHIHKLRMAIKNGDIKYPLSVVKVLDTLEAIQARLEAKVKEL